MSVVSKKIDLLRLIELIRDSSSNSEYIYTKGSCIRFCLILKHVYPEGDIMWNENHAVFRFHGSYYDITGEVSGVGYDKPLEEYGIVMVEQLLKLKY